MINGLKYCTKCVMPETVEDQSFDKDGLCRTCQSQSQKKSIDWNKREIALRKILTEAKSKSGNNYDCIVPISGGKDSMYQLHVIVKEYGMKPLAVTFNHGWFSETGWYNLQNALEKMDIDHVMFTPSRSLVNRIAKHSLGTLGDVCWHCHMGVSAYTLRMAVAYKIPLLIWGESTAEHGRATYEKPDKFDRDYFLRVSAKLTPEQFACEYLTLKDLFPFVTPSVEECEELGLNGIHLGDYIPWDTEKQVEFVKAEYNWKGTEIEGAYKDYKSAECSMAGMHDFTCYCKRGYGRASIQLSGDIRDKLLELDADWYAMLETEQMRPKSLDYYLEITGMSEMEFYETLSKLKHPALEGKHVPIIKDTRLVPEAGKPYVERFLEGENI